MATSSRRHLPCRSSLDHQTLDLVLDRPDLAHEIARFVGRNGGGNDCAADAAGAAERHFARDIDVRNLWLRVSGCTSRDTIIDARSCPRTAEAGAAG